LEVEEEAHAEVSLRELVSESQLPPLDAEEEEMLGALEENIQGLRHLEKQIFSSPPETEKPESDSNPTDTPHLSPPSES
jgi:hypothetical protein